MSDSTRTNDESDITAYVLGELEPADREAFERLLAGDARLQREADVLRDVASLVFLALQSEPNVRLTAAQRERVRTAAATLQDASQSRTTLPTVARPSPKNRRWAARGIVVLATLVMFATGLLLTTTVTPEPEILAETPVHSYNFWRVTPLDSNAVALTNGRTALSAEQLQLAFQMEGSVPTHWVSFDASRGLNYVEVPYGDRIEKLYVTEAMGWGASTAAARTDLWERRELDRLSDFEADTKWSDEALNGVESDDFAASVDVPLMELPTTDPAPAAASREAEIERLEQLHLYYDRYGDTVDESRARRMNSLSSSAAGGYGANPAGMDPAIVNEPYGQPIDGLLPEQQNGQSRPGASNRATSNYATPPAPEASRRGGVDFDADGDGVVDMSNGTLLLRSRTEELSKFRFTQEQQGVMAGSAIESAERKYLADEPRPDSSGLGGSAVPTMLGVQTEIDSEQVLSETEHIVAETVRQLNDFTLEEQLARKPQSGFAIQNEWYAPVLENTFVSPLDEPVSTFSTDVDTAAFTNVRRFIDAGLWPPADAVRVEELVNYFEYSLPPPADDHPIAVAAEAAACPWKPEHRLARVTLQARDIDAERRPPTTLVFLTDVSGSMRDDNKLPLVQQSLKLLTERLTENDRVALVTYADEAQLQLDSTPGDRHTEIIAAIDALQADGSTNGAGGLTLAYDVARRHFVDHGANRVILCSDGDFNVGISSDDELVQLIEEQRRSGVFLSVFGFGTGNLKDAKLEALADHGNGHYGYVDTLDEARRVFVEQITGTLYTVAKDVKLQIDFNPLKVAAYRLIGYENRALAAADFDVDTVDAGDMGADQSATALYELTLRSDSNADEAAVLGKSLEQRSARFGLAQEQQVAVRIDRNKLTIDGQVITEDARQNIGRTVEALYDAPQQQARYLVENRLSVVNRPAQTDSAVPLDDLLTIRVRYKRPAADESRLLQVPLVDAGVQQVPSDDFAWSSAVASFALLLRQSPYRGLATFDAVIETASAAKGDDPTGRRREFIDMAQRARAIWEAAHGESPPTPIELTSTDARTKATVGGQYDVLLDKLAAPEDLSAYGPFYQYGWWTGSQYRDHKGLPPGYWVYVFPDWYIWQERTTP